MGARENHIAEMERLKKAMKETRSDYLRIDYGKKLKKMKKELEIYDKYRRGEM